MLLWPFIWFNTCVSGTSLWLLKILSKPSLEEEECQEADLGLLMCWCVRRRWEGRGVLKENIGNWDCRKDHSHVCTHMCRHVCIVTYISRHVHIVTHIPPLLGYRFELINSF